MSTSSRGTPRSKNGCWTCKIRKKKCDESGPPCGRCTSSKIECHGYGEKPEWLHRKSNPKRKRQRPDPGSGNDSSSNGSNNSPRSTAISSLPITTPYSASTQNLHNREKDHEAELLLHYLEKVFPLQWQFYKGPNAWILPLLSQSKAIYHSVLSISAIHRAVLQQKYPSPMHNDNDLQHHHQLTLQELRNSISTDKNQSKTVQSLAAVIMLTSFELFQGGYQNWQHHMQAGVTLVRLITDTGKVPAHTDAEKFLIACVVWMDTLASATTYASSKSSVFVEGVVSTESILPLHKLMGCRIEVLIQLNEVMKLYEWKIQQQEAACLSLAELVQRSKEIEDKLAVEYDKDSSDSLTANTTKLFSLATMVCLYGVVSGYSPDLPEIEAIVEKCFPIFDRIPSQYYRGLVFPICVLGSMSQKRHHDRFLSLFGNNPTELAFGNFAQTRNIMEHTWKLREQNGNKFVNWVSAMEDLRVPLLLV